MTSMTSITSMLAVGFTTGSAMLIAFLIFTMVTKELSTVAPDVDRRLVDSLNAVLVPLAFAFLTIVVLHMTSVV